jgi:hypothetical protein
MMMRMMMKSVGTVRLLVIITDVLGSILKGVVCRCLLLELNIIRFLFLTMLLTNSFHFFLSFTN